MSSRLSDWETLNAYVDGELEAAEAAEIADRIAHDPVLARQAAALAGMKAALTEPVGTPAFDFGPLARERRYRVRRMAAAAAAVFLIVIGAALWTMQTNRAAPAWLIAAADAHASLAAQRPNAPPQAEQIVLAAGFHPYIPVLSSAKLTLASAAPFRIDELPAGVALQYTGTRGCRVTYLAFSAEDTSLGEALSPVVHGNLSGFSWRVGAVGYALLAHGMDPERLAVIAANVHAASRRHRPFDEAARTQMAQSRAESRACTV